MTEPTPQDIRNAEVRRQIADRFRQEYDQCQALAERAFGPGWLPSARHFLLDIEDEDRCRYTGQRPVPAATVYTVTNAAGKRRHFSVASDGQVTEHLSPEAGFGPMLCEPHPTRTIEVAGRLVHPHRYSLCWSGYELYRPKTAEQLADARANRRRKAADRAAAEYPLFADQIRSEEARDGPAPEHPAR